MVETDPVTRWRSEDFPLSFPGTSARTWRRDYIPRLINAGVLQKIGRAWFGKRSEIEAALLGRFASPATPSLRPAKATRSQNRRARKSA